MKLNVNSYACLLICQGVNEGKSLKKSEVTSREPVACHLFLAAIKQVHILSSSPSANAEAKDKK